MMTVIRDHARGATVGGSSGVAKAEIRMLGGFEVLLDGTPVPAAGWPRPQAATLVKVLALASGRRMHRERLIDQMWPDLTITEAAPRLHKLAHYARRGLGDDRMAVVLRGETVALLRQAGRWEDLLAEDPADEDAHVALMMRHIEKGDHRAALRQFERMDAALRRELGVGPGRRAVAVHEQILAALPEHHADAGQASLVGRRTERERLGRLLADAGHGGGRTVLVSGPAGIGKSALLEWVSERAERSGWRVGHGVAAAVEGAWPYARCSMRSPICAGGIRRCSTGWAIPIGRRSSVHRPATS